MKKQTPRTQLNKQEKKLMHFALKRFGQLEKNQDNEKHELEGFLRVFDALRKVMETKNID